MANSFKDDIERQASPHIGSQLTRRQRTSFVNRVLRVISACLWIDGCPAPRVKDFEAHIEQFESAVPKIQQPLPLCQFDQSRLEYQEDLDVHEGKAEWISAGQAGSWGSTLFVVDQDGKGLRGRAVRDYRYVNSQTADTPWPSASAAAFLERAQQGAPHTTMDAVWGFNHLPADDATGELLQTVARRGILRPRVLYMGPKQGLGIFQSFMDWRFRKVKGPDGEEFTSIFAWTTSV